MASENIPAGFIIGDRFELGSRVGAGGLGAVFTALDRKANKQVAIRIFADDLTSSESAMDQLREQVKKASALQHKNIARVFGMGKEGSLRYLAMELVDGQSLRELLHRKRLAGRPFSLKGAYNVLAHACNALHHSHQSMTHGLPGPGAILINRAGRVKVVDFGIVVALAPGSSAMAQMGDAYALSPEVRADPRSAGPHADVYTMGVVLHELLTTQRPSVPPRPGTDLVGKLPPAVEEVVWRSLQEDPGQRFSDVQQLKAAFYQAIEGYGPGSDDGIADTGAHPVLQHPVEPRPAPQSQPAPRAVPESLPIQPMAASPAPAAVHVAVPEPLSAVPSNTHPLTHAPQTEVNIEDLLVEADGDTHERWLVQKDRLDFGPFTAGALKRALHKTEFTGEDLLVDQDTGRRMTVRQHPEFQDFMRHLDRHLARSKAQQVELKQRVEDRKRRTVLVTMLVIGIAILAAGGVVAAWLLTKKPEIREKVVYREKTKLLDGIKGLEVQWKAEPPDQARKRRHRPRTRKKGSSEEDVTHLGDVTKAGGDQLLSQTVVQNVMRSSFSKLSPCVQEEWRRDRSLRQVDIDFAILGSGAVSSVKVNGKTSGPFHSCVRQRMRSIQFPRFDGTLTRASFSMRLQI